jgi:hypothetical protein
VLSSVLSCCVQSIFRKSIFTVSGAAQTIAGTKSENLYSRLWPIDCWAFLSSLTQWEKEEMYRYFQMFVERWWSMQNL